MPGNYGGGLGPDDLDLLYNILEAELKRRHLSRDSEQAKSLAKMLINRFKSGVTAPDQLREYLARAIFRSDL
ncbi:hypothetical protein KXS15_16870 [Sinorhizobium meliloti]